MELWVENWGTVRCVRVPVARVDAAIAVMFKEALLQAAEDGPPRILLDLGGVTFLDSSGLGAIVAVFKALAPDRRLELAGASGAVDQVFRLTRMDRVFVIHPDAHSVTGALPHAS